MKLNMNMDQNQQIDHNMQHSSLEHLNRSLNMQ